MSLSTAVAVFAGVIVLAWAERVHIRAEIRRALVEVETAHTAVVAKIKADVAGAFKEAYAEATAIESEVIAKVHRRINSIL